MTIYTYTVILNVTLVIHIKNAVNAKKSIHISADFRLQNRILPPNINVLQFEDICI